MRQSMELTMYEQFNEICCYSAAGFKSNGDGYEAMRGNSRHQDDWVELLPSNLTGTHSAFRSDYANHSD